MDEGPLANSLKDLGFKTKTRLVVWQIDRQTHLSISVEVLRIIGKGCYLILIFCSLPSPLVLRPLVLSPFLKKIYPYLPRQGYTLA